METIKSGSEVLLLVGSKGKRGSVYTVKKVVRDRVYLDGYRLFKRTTKITQDNTSNYRTVHHPVHISNVQLQKESK
jgi:ribosomal protein L24